MKQCPRSTWISLQCNWRDPWKFLWKLVSCREGESRFARDEKLWCGRECHSLHQALIALRMECSRARVIVECSSGGREVASFANVSARVCPARFEWPGIHMMVTCGILFVCREKSVVICLWYNTDTLWPGCAEVFRMLRAAVVLSVRKIMEEMCGIWVQRRTVADAPPASAKSSPSYALARWPRPHWPDLTW